MRFIAPILGLLGLVMLMAGRNGFRVGQQIGLVILGFVVLMLVFGLAVDRTL